MALCLVVISATGREDVVIVFMATATRSSHKMLLEMVRPDNNPERHVSCLTLANLPRAETVLEALES